MIIKMKFKYRIAKKYNKIRKNYFKKVIKVN